MRIGIERIITGTDADALYATHQEVFAPIDPLAVEQQSLPADLFYELLGHPEVLEFVARDDTGRAPALMIVTTRLDLVPWVRPGFLEARYPEHAARGALYYVPCIQLSPDAQDGGLIEAMIESFSLYMGARKGVLVFDCCQWDIDNLAVPQFVERYARRTVEAEFLEIDAQRYFGYEAFGLKELDLRDAPGHGVTIDLTEPAPSTTDVPS